MKFGEEESGKWEGEKKEKESGVGLTLFRGVGLFMRADGVCVGCI